MAGRVVAALACENAANGARELEGGGGAAADLEARLGPLAPDGRCHDHMAFPQGVEAARGQDLGEGDIRNGPAGLVREVPLAAIVVAGERQELLAGAQVVENPPARLEAQRDDARAGTRAQDGGGQETKHPAGHQEGLRGRIISGISLTKMASCKRPAVTTRTTTRTTAGRPEGVAPPSATSIKDIRWSRAM